MLGGYWAGRHLRLIVFGKRGKETLQYFGTWRKSSPIVLRSVCCAIVACFCLFLLGIASSCVLLPAVGCSCVLSQTTCGQPLRMSPRWKNMSLISFWKRPLLGKEESATRAMVCSSGFLSRPISSSLYAKSHRKNKDQVLSKTM